MLDPKIVETLDLLERIRSLTDEKESETTVKSYVNKIIHYTLDNFKFEWNEDLDKQISKFINNAENIKVDENYLHQVNESLIPIIIAKLLLTLLIDAKYNISEVFANQSGFIRLAERYIDAMTTRYLVD